MLCTIEKDFIFIFECKDARSTLKVPVSIPLEQSVNDLVGRLVKAHNLPCYTEDGRCFVVYHTSV